MKTKSIFFKIFKALSLAAMTMVLVNCSKDNGNNVVATNTGYYLNANGTCYQNGTNQVMPNTYCTNSGQYVMQNGLCYQVLNGQYIQQSSTTLCSTAYNSYQIQNGICYQVVNGQYLQQPNMALCNNSSNVQTAVCNGYYSDGSRMALCTPGATGVTSNGNALVMNCSGYTLYSQTGQIVRCQ